jgi:hypothetical protein
MLRTVGQAQQDWNEKYALVAPRVRLDTENLVLKK